MYAIRRTALHHAAAAPPSALRTSFLVAVPAPCQECSPSNGASRAPAAPSSPASQDRRPLCPPTSNAGPATPSAQPRSGTCPAPPETRVRPPRFHIRGSASRKPATAARGTDTARAYRRGAPPIRSATPSWRTPLRLEVGPQRLPRQISVQSEAQVLVHVRHVEARAGGAPADVKVGACVGGIALVENHNLRLGRVVMYL